MMKRLILAFLLIAVFSVPVHAFQNGSFEFGTAVPPAGYLQVDSPDDGVSITDWNVLSGNVDIITTYWPAAEGSRSIDLNGDTAGTLLQTIPTTNGCTYTVTFALSGNNPIGSIAEEKTLEVYINGAIDSPIASFSTTGSAQNNEWADETFSFVANSPGPATMVYFRSTTAGNGGPAIDNLRLEEECPPPASIPTMNEWGMMIFMALAGLIAVYYMRKQTSV